MPSLSQKFYDAIEHATSLHRDQLRKGENKTPYIVHPVSVAMRVLQHGGDEEQAIAALLHDVIEDQGHQISLDELESQYGPRVKQIVAECSEGSWPAGEEKPFWKSRKNETVKKMKIKSFDGVFVSCADKLDNLQAMIKAYEQTGEKLWEKFKGGKEGTLWYHRKLSTTFLQRMQNNSLATAHSDALNQFEQMIKHNAPPKLSHR